MSTEEKERRRLVRVPVGIMVSIRSEQDAELFTTNYSSDLSLGGVFLKTLNPKPVGTKVIIEVPIPELPGYSEIQGEVTFQKRVSTGDGVKAGMGVKFTKMDSKARFALQQFINGNWRSLFKKPECLENEEAAIKALMSVINLFEALFFFPFGKNQINHVRSLQKH